MATNTTSKLALGQLILVALVSVTSKLTKAARDAFMDAYDALREAVAAVKAAERNADAASDRANAADEDQDRATLALASKLIGDGFSRSNPFKAFGVIIPSKLVELGHVEEANVLIALAARVMEHPDVSATTKKAAAAVDRAARTMKTADAARLESLERRAQAIAFRDRDLPEAFSLALTNLRAAIRYADVEENTAYYRTVFGQLPKAAKKKKKTPTPPVS